MTATGHRLAGLGVAGAMTLAAMHFAGPWAAIAAASTVMSGANAPDWLEIPYGEGKRLITHRTITHWVMPWVGAVFVAFHLADQFHPLLVWGFAGFVAGALTHLSGDILTPMGVPLFSPVTRTHLARLRSGGLGEALWCAGVWLAGLVVLWVMKVPFPFGPI